MLPGPIAEFVEGGVGIHLGTRNARFEPNGARALAVKVNAEGTLLTVFLSAIAADRLLADLESNGQAAVSFGRPVDERACQIKGVVVGIRAAEAAERELVEGQWQGYLTQLNLIGIPREPLANWTIWPALAVTLKATALFEQTPGAGAGEAMR
jgi:hypothetical protein